ncbi:MAG: hypothetical protein L0219_00975 [Phycisphaerales bacterium]|nr:hypothetical protein [Phycisphaerales bacterium]
MNTLRHACRDRGRRAVSIVAAVSCLLLVSLIVIANDKRGEAGPQADVSGSTDFAPAPKPDVIDDLICIICVILGDDCDSPQNPNRCQWCKDEGYDVNCDHDDKGLSGLERVIADNSGSIPSAQRVWAQGVLNMVEDWIGTIQGTDPPDLTPRNAGIPGTSMTFSSLQQCAEQCTDWANEAMDAMEASTTPDHETAGDRLDSIRLALPQYRSLGGL